MTQMSQILSAYFDGDLTPEERASLRSWLLEGAQNIDEYVIESFVHTQLIDWLNAYRTRANALVAAEHILTAVHGHRSYRFVGRILGLAVSVVLVGTFWLLAVSRNPIVATVIGNSNASWVLNATARNVGSLLKAGDEISIESGMVRIAFARGGQVALHGPVCFRIDSESSGQLLSGSLSAFVPEHAVGFCIRTKKLTLVDLGTEFRVDLFDNDSCELQVFQGLVEIQFDQQFRTNTYQKKLQISQGRAVQFDGRSGTVKAIRYNNEKRLSSSAW